jgi:hypothetical protein
MQCTSWTECHHKSSPSELLYKLQLNMFRFHPSYI